jgi:hypothetical protein
MDGKHMNKRIKELLNQAGIYQPDRFDAIDGSNQMEKFAELIVKECAKVAWYNTPDTEELEYSHLIEDKILEHFGVE